MGICATSAESLAFKLCARENAAFYKKEDFPFSNSLTIHEVQTKEIMTVTVFGYLILISIDFYDVISPFSP